MTAFWFRGHELSTAFGVTLTASRLGSVVSFLATPIIQHKSVSGSARTASSTSRVLCNLMIVFYFDTDVGASGIIM